MYMLLSWIVDSIRDCIRRTEGGVQWIPTYRRVSPRQVPTPDPEIDSTPVCIRSSASVYLHDEKVGFGVWGHLPLELIPSYMRLTTTH